MTRVSLMYMCMILVCITVSTITDCHMISVSNSWTQLKTKGSVPPSCYGSLFIHTASCCILTVLYTGTLVWSLEYTCMSSEAAL
jgi:hypothetical protein